MRQRQIKTELLRDNWFITLTPDEKWFFTYFLVSPDIGLAGIGQIPDKIICFDTGFDIDTVKYIKQRMEKVNKLFFHKEWVCIANFYKHNNMLNGGKALTGAASQVESLPKPVFEYFNKKLKETGADMSLDNYLEIKRRNRARKELRKRYPSLMGQQLEDKVDHYLGIADSGKVDWAMLKDNSVTSDYPTADSLTYDDFIEVADQYRVRPYILHWFFKKKVAKLNARGVDRTNYKSVLKDVASASIGKDLDMDTKIVAITMFAKDMKNVTITRSQAEGMIVRGEI